MYLTTVGRRTGRRHRIEIWFTVDDHRIYVISGGGTRSDWVKNLLDNPAVEIEIGEHGWHATATPDDGPDHPARERLAARYQGWSRGQPLTTWATAGLVVEFTIGDLQHPPADS